MTRETLRAYTLFPIAEKVAQRRISSKVKVLAKDAKFSWEDRKKRLQNQLFCLLSDAQKNVPYYRDLFRSIQFDPKVIKVDLGYMNELPYLTKETIREQGLRLIHENYPIEQLHVRKTGGSTGPTLPIYYSTDALDWTSAENIFVLSFTGHRLGKKEVQIVPQKVFDQTLQSAVTEKLKNYTLNRKVISTGCMDESTLDDMWKRLRRIKPYLVQGPPSILYALALHIEKHDLPRIKLFSAFESTGETLDHAKLTAIESTIGCKVYNRYGTAEFGVVAHSRDLHNQLEVVDYLVYPETCSLGNGLNEIVLTGLTNPVMPLIRYKTGDIGEISFKNERYWLSKLQGRVHDLIYINNQPHLTTYIQDFLEQVGGVDEFQISIDKLNKKTLKIVPSPTCDQMSVKQRVHDLFGDEFQIEFTNFNGLVLQGWRSKFRYVVRGTV